MISHPSRFATSTNRSGVTPLTIDTIGSTMWGRYPRPLLLPTR